MPLSCSRQIYSPKVCWYFPFGCLWMFITNQIFFPLSLSTSLNNIVASDVITKSFVIIHKLKNISDSYTYFSVSIHISIHFLGSCILLPMGIHLSASSFSGIIHENLKQKLHFVNAHSKPMKSFQYIYTIRIVIYAEKKV